MYYLQNKQERLSIAYAGHRVALDHHRSWHDLERMIFGSYKTGASKSQLSAQAPKRSLSDHSISICVGDSVMVNWRLQGTYFRGKVMSVSKSNAVSILYDDDYSKDTVAPKAVRLVAKKMNDLNAELPKRTGHEKPMLLALGHGTTGTRTLFEAICKLGIPSAHHQQVCSPTGAPTRGGFRLHTQLSELFFGLRRNSTFCAFLNSTIIDRIKKTIDAMIATGDIDALLDSPYPYFSSYLIHAAERIRGVPPIIILTLRDPLDWAKKRTLKHPLESFCRQSLNATILEMDFFKCFHHAFKNEKPENIRKEIVK